MASARPTLVYDGDCGICRRWVDYWQTLTGGAVAYRPYQEAAADFPAIPRAAFERAIQFVEPDGTVHAGAAATFRLLTYAPARRGWWWLYRRVPPFAAASERAYAFFAAHRDLLAVVTRLLWGRTLEAERYALASALFLRLFGAIYVAAFASLGVQIVGLVGDQGILPLVSYLRAAHDALGAAAYVGLPTLFWLDASDPALVAGTVAGVVLGLSIMLGRATRAALVGAFVLYLSYRYAGQDFMHFQWDLLLLEAGFLAIFLTGGSRIVVWLFRWLTLRYVFLAGAAKLLSGDPTWRSLSALDFHFWTQPLPTPLAWYAAQLPPPLLAAGTAATLAVELGIVFGVFLPRRLRAFAGLAIIAFQLLIVLTGNYNFFNLLTMLLCLFLFDDAALRRVVPRRVAARAVACAPQPGRVATLTAGALAAIVVPVGLNRIAQSFLHADLPLAGTMQRLVAPLAIVNGYGLFAVMTTARPEIVIEGSDDGDRWREYVFRYKPGPLARAPPWSLPHQPRLDWQMWFAALSGAQDNPWFVALVGQLLDGSADVTALLDGNPFPERPPRYVRALLYEYRFADPATHRATGQWWIRNPAGLYFPAVSAEDFDSR